MSLRPSVLLVLLLVGACQAEPNVDPGVEPVRNPTQVWFTPSVGSADMQGLFSEPARWESARAIVDVIAFNAQHLNSFACHWCVTNTVTNLASAGAFSKVVAWGKKTAVEIAPPIPHNAHPSDCAAEYDYARQQSSAWTADAVANLTANGGIADYLALDEPLRRWLSREYPVGGPAPACGVDTTPEIAPLVSPYVDDLRAAYPAAEIGQIILYPTISVNEIQEYVVAMEDLGSPLSFVHLDVHGQHIIELGMPNASVSMSQVRADLLELESFFASHNIEFGVILIDLVWNTRFWEPGEYTDQTYFEGTMDWIREVHRALGTPARSLFQSWVSPAYTDGRELSQVIPINLPEDDPTIYSHTRLVLEGYDLLTL